MKNDFTLDDLTAIHTRLLLESKQKVEAATLDFSIAKGRAKDEGVHWRNVKDALEFLDQNGKEHELRVETLQKTLRALGHDAQLSFDFVRVADDWDRLRGQGRMAAIQDLPCEPPAGLKGHNREVWVDGWTAFMKVFDAYQDVLDEQSTQDTSRAMEALDKALSPQ